MPWEHKPPDFGRFHVTKHLLGIRCLVPQSVQLKHSQNQGALPHGDTTPSVENLSLPISDLSMGGHMPSGKWGAKRRSQVKRARKTNPLSCRPNRIQRTQEKKLGKPPRFSDLIQRLRWHQSARRSAAGSARGSLRGWCSPRACESTWLEAPKRGASKA